MKNLYHNISSRASLPQHLGWLLAYLFICIGISVAVLAHNLVEHNTSYSLNDVEHHGSDQTPEDHKDEEEKKDHTLFLDLVTFKSLGNPISYTISEYSISNIALPKFSPPPEFI